MVELSIKHFRDLLAEELRNLESFCLKWEEVSTDLFVPEGVRGEIRTAIGLTKLLMNQKLKQFAGLIDDSEFKRSEKEITCLDLQGFWDMVYQEVEKISKTFEKLENYKKNNWEIKEPSPVKAKTKKLNVPKIVKPSVTSSQSTKAHILAARKRIAEARNKMKTADAANAEFVTINVAKSPRIAVKQSAKKEVQKSEKNKENLKNSDTVQSPRKKLALGVKGPTGEKQLSTGNGRKPNKSREIMPLQCITRSAARKALLMKQK